MHESGSARGVKDAARSLTNTGRFKLTRISVKFTAKELELLSSLASDQLFRREFIDSRLPGCDSNLVELGIGKQLLARLKSAADRATRMPPAKNGVAGLRRSRAAAVRGAHSAG